MQKYKVNSPLIKEELHIEKKENNENILFF